MQLVSILTMQLQLASLLAMQLQLASILAMQLQLVPILAILDCSALTTLAPRPKLGRWCLAHCYQPTP